MNVTFEELASANMKLCTARDALSVKLEEAKEEIRKLQSELESIKVVSFRQQLILAATSNQRICGISLTAKGYATNAVEYADAVLKLLGDIK